MRGRNVQLLVENAKAYFEGFDWDKRPKESMTVHTETGEDFVFDDAEQLATLRVECGALLCGSPVNIAVETSHIVSICYGVDVDGDEP